MSTPASAVRPCVLPLLAASAVRAALVLLQGAYQCAHLLQRPAADFALPLDLLRRTGLSDTQLLALIEAGQVEYLPPSRPAGGPLPRRPGRKGMVDEGARVVLTAAGVVPLSAPPAVPQPPAVTEPPGVLPLERPSWARRHRELHFRGRLVKRFRRLAPNQFAVLDAFEELGWPWCIDDPLPQDPGTLPADRLEDAVDRLNKNLARSCLRFAVTADRQGVRWGVRRRR